MSFKVIANTGQVYNYCEKRGWTLEAAAVYSVQHGGAVALICRSRHFERHRTTLICSMNMSTIVYLWFARLTLRKRARRSGETGPLYADVQPTVDIPHHMYSMVVSRSRDMWFEVRRDSPQSVRDKVLDESGSFLPHPDRLRPCTPHKRHSIDPCMLPFEYRPSPTQLTRVPSPLPRELNWWFG